MATADGPTMEQYIETRLNLLTKAIAKIEETIDRRFAAMEEAQKLVAKNIEGKFRYQEQMSVQASESAKRAVDKAESQQAAINMAQNEWRSTLNDFKGTLVGRSEYDRLAGDFAAYKLEAARLFSAAAGEKTAAKEVHGEVRSTREDNRAGVSLAVSIGVGILAAASFVMALVGMFGPAQPAQPLVVNVPAPAAPPATK